MLPLFDVPILHYSVKEAVSAGIEHIVIVVSDRQEAVKTYFENDPSMVAALEQKGQQNLLDEMESISTMAEISYITQKQPEGLGHAVLSTKSLIGNEPFALLLPDDVIWSEPPTIRKLADLYKDWGGAVIAIREASRNEIPKLGIIDAIPIDSRFYEVNGLVEKPKLETAPSNLAITGRYILTPQIFEALELTPPGINNEIQLTDALAITLQENKIYAFRFPGDHFDVGNPTGLLKASVYSALQRDDISFELLDWLKTL